MLGSVEYSCNDEEATVRMEWQAAHCFLSRKMDVLGFGKRVFESVRPQVETTAGNRF
jgi:hypothetical protein